MCFYYPRSSCYSCANFDRHLNAICSLLCPVTFHESYPEIHYIMAGNKFSIHPVHLSNHSTIKFRRTSCTNNSNDNNTHDLNRAAATMQHPEHKTALLMAILLAKVRISFVRPPNWSGGTTFKFYNVKTCATPSRSPLPPPPPPSLALHPN